MRSKHSIHQPATKTDSATDSTHSINIFCNLYLFIPKTPHRVHRMIQLYLILLCAMPMSILASYNNPSFSAPFVAQSNVARDGGHNDHDTTGNVHSSNADSRASPGQQYYQPQQQQQQQQQHPVQESFEERTAAWRRHQEDMQSNQTPQQQASATDEEGRMKLIATVSKGSISFFFFVLMWRSIHHYEMADVSLKGLARTSLVLPTVGLFVANLAGCFASLSPPSTVTKKRLKLILNGNKIIESMLFVYHFLRLTVFSSEGPVREVYVGRIITNFLFVVQCQLFTKVTWDGVKVQTRGVEDSQPLPVYDDYIPDDNQEYYNYYND